MRYSMLTYLEDAGVNNYNKLLWKLKCDCGQTCVKIASAVRIGKTKSCGCLQKAGNRRTHGLRKHPLYVTWCNMKARCDNKNHPQFKDYGGRGITYCDNWSTFDNFLSDVGEKPFKKATLDRIDNDGNYEPSNVRWACRITQRRNTRAIRPVTIDVETKLLTDWCRKYNIHEASVYRRMNKGMTLAEAISTPKAKRFR